MKRPTSTIVAVIGLVVAALPACVADDPVSPDEDNVEDPSDWLGHGELLPAPDYEAVADSTYTTTVAEAGGPETAEDWVAVDTFELALDEASGELWRALPGVVADEFPGMTEAERNAMISDFQDAVATAHLMRESSTDPENCVEIYETQDGGATGTWTPLCEDELAPEVEGAVPALVGAVVVRVAFVAGRWAVRRAAPHVARFVTQRALPAARVAAGRAVQAVRAAMPVVRMRAGQAAMWARQQAGAGWAYVKQRYQQARWWQRALAWEALFEAHNVYSWAHEQLFGTPETAEEEAAIELLRGDDPGSLDVVFDL